MSFDLILQRSRPFAVDEVIAAFTTATQGDLLVDGALIAGRGFELAIEPGAEKLHVTCAWTFAVNPQRQQPIRVAAGQLGASVFDPQIRRFDATEDKPVIVRDPSWAGQPFASEQLAGVNTVDSASVITVPPGQGELVDALHELYLLDAATPYARNDARHPGNLRDLACSYARLPAGVLPFEIFVAHGSGKTRDGEPSGFAHRAFVLVDKQLGLLQSLDGNLVPGPEGGLVNTWDSLALKPVGRGDRRLGVQLDLTERVHAIARAALEHARVGDTVPLRTFLVQLVSIDACGLAAAEHGALELLDDGARMDVWVCRAFGPAVCSAQLRVTDRAFSVVIDDQGDAPAHKQLPRLLGGSHTAQIIF
jgi:hypothetical protein